MRDAIKGVVAGMVVLALLLAIASRAGWIVTAPPRPEGTSPWLLSRATGLVAYAALSLDVIAGLLVSTRTADSIVPRAALVDLHGWLSPLALAFVLGHAGILVADNYVRFDVIDVVVPFATARWPLAVGVGTLAAYLALVVHASFAFRKRLGAAVWRRVHYLSFAAFTLATVHALAVGTDRGQPWFASIYVAILGGVGWLLALRIKRALANTATGTR